MTMLSGPYLGSDIATETVALVAPPPPTTKDDSGGKGEDFGKSSPLGLLVLLLFFVAVAFLIRSMTKHLKRVPASFDKEPAGSEDPKSPPKDSSGGDPETA